MDNRVTTASVKTATAAACELAGEAIAKFGMLRPGAHVLAAFSGGADSTALAIVLGSLGYRVTLAHIDHGMRAGSQFDVFHCRSSARRLGMDLEVARVKVDPPTEASARRVRYEALETLAEKVGAVRIASGHTLNDEAETVKMRLARGGFGLGIPPVRGKIIRPLLSVGRRTTEEVCREAGILFLDDPTNLDLRFTRNRIRRELAAGGEGVMERLVSIGSESRAAKNSLEARLSDLCSLSITDPGPRLALGAVRDAPGPVASGLVRRLLEAAGVEASGRLIDDVLAKVARRPGSSLDLPGGLAVWNEPGALNRADAGDAAAQQGSLVVGPRRLPEIPLLPEVPLRVPGITRAPGWGLDVEVCLEPAAPDPAQGVRSGPRPSAKPPWTESFDAGKLEAGLVLRSWRPGDRFLPLRREGPPFEKKLQDFFVDHKVPRLDRHRVPLIFSGEKIVWVAGHRIDDRCKITSQTRTVARITIVLSDGSRP